MPDDTPPGNVHLLPGVEAKILLQLLADLAKREGYILAPKAREIGADDVTLSEEVDEFFASCKDKIDWLLEPYVFDGCFTLVQGAPKGGKTLLVVWIAVCIALSGKKVLFVEEEGARETLRDRLKPFLPDTRAVRGKLKIVFRKRIRLDKQESVDALIAEIRRTCARLLVLDPFVALHTKREKEQDEMAGVMNAIRQIITETGVAVLLVHHTRKGESWNKSSNVEAQSEDSRGSGVLIGEADQVIAVKGLPPAKRKEGEIGIIVENPDSRVAAPFTRKLVTFRLGDGSMGEIDVQARDAADADDLLERILSVLPHAPQWTSISGLRSALRVKQNRLVEAIDILQAKGLVVRELNKGFAKPARTPYPDPSGTAGKAGKPKDAALTRGGSMGTPGKGGKADFEGPETAGTPDPDEQYQNGVQIHDPEDP